MTKNLGEIFPSAQDGNLYDTLKQQLAAITEALPTVNINLVQKKDSYLKNQLVSIYDMAQHAPRFYKMETAENILTPVTVHSVDIPPLDYENRFTGTLDIYESTRKIGIFEEEQIKTKSYDPENLGKETVETIARQIALISFELGKNPLVTLQTANDLYPRPIFDFRNDKLTATVLAFKYAYNEKAPPFVWTSSNIVTNIGTETPHMPGQTKGNLIVTPYIPRR